MIKTQKGQSDLSGKSIIATVWVRMERKNMVSFFLVFTNVLQKRF